MKNTSLITLTFAMLGLFGFTSCADTGGEITEQNDVTIEPAETPEEKQTQAHADTASDRPVLGETWRYDDGLEVTMSEPEAFTPGEYSSGGEDAEHYIIFELMLQNNTGDDFDPSTTFVTASSAGTEAEEIFDHQEGLEGPSMTTLLDGQSTSYELGFGVSDPTDLTVEFNDFNDLDRPSVIFVSE